VQKLERSNKNRNGECELNTIVLEATEHGDMPIDVYQKLSNDRILFISDEIHDSLAADIAATLLLKDAEDSDKKITLFINSHGGDIRNVLMICDMMNMISAPIETVCVGSAMDEAAIILSSGTPGMRFATKNAVISAGQLVNTWMVRSNLTDAKKNLELITTDNKRMMEILAKTSNKTLKQVMSHFERRVFMNSHQAMKFGLIDKVVALKK
jgi:ATP-dependent Clp protease protease subunit